MSLNTLLRGVALVFFPIETGIMHMATARDPEDRFPTAVLLEMLIKWDKVGYLIFIYML